MGKRTMRLPQRRTDPCAWGGCECRAVGQSKYCREHRETARRRFLELVRERQEKQASRIFMIRAQGDGEIVKRLGSEESGAWTAIDLPNIGVMVRLDINPLTQDPYCKIILTGGYLRGAKDGQTMWTVTLVDGALPFYKVHEIE